MISMLLRNFTSPHNQAEYEFDECSDKKKEKKNSDRFQWKQSRYKSEV